MYAILNCKLFFKKERIYCWPTLFHCFVHSCSRTHIWGLSDDIWNCLIDCSHEHLMPASTLYQDTCVRFALSSWTLWIWNEFCININIDLQSGLYTFFGMPLCAPSWRTQLESLHLAFLLCKFGREEEIHGPSSCVFAYRIPIGSTKCSGQNATYCDRLLHCT